MPRKILKITLYIIAAVILLALAAVVCLDTPWGQNFVRRKVVTYLNDKLKTKVDIGHFGVGFPKFIVLDNVLFLDQAKDTLLAAGELKIDLNMLRLIDRKVLVQQVLLTGVRAHIYRNLPDTNYNFSYIVNAFAGKANDAPKPKKSGTPAFDVNLDRVRLDDIHFRMDDYTGGMRYGLNLDHLNLNLKKTDISHMLFQLKDLSVSGLQTTYAQDTSYIPINPLDTAKVKFQLTADNINLANISFGYNDNLNKLLFGLRIGSLQLKLNKFDLQDNLIDVRKISMNNSDIGLTLGKLAKPPRIIDTLIKKDTTEGWDIRVADMDLGGVNFRMDDENCRRQPSGIDYSHLNMAGIVLKLHKLIYTSDAISANIEHMAGKEQSGLIISELRTDFTYNQQGVVLNKLFLQTPTTVLQNYIEVHYPSLDTLQKHIETLQLNVNVVNSTVGLNDVSIFMPPDEQKQLSKYKQEKIRLDATMTGFLNNLEIKHLYASGLGNTLVSLDGNVKGLPELKNLKYDLHIANFQTSSRDVSAFIPDTMLSSIRLPDRFGAVGHVAGTEYDYNTDLVIATTDGNAYLKGSLLMSGGQGKETYDMAIRTDRLNVGRILKQDSLIGAITLMVHAKGRSFDVKTMDAVFDGKIPAAYVKGYGYHDLSLSAKVAARRVDILFNSVDTNLQVQLAAHADFTGKYAAASGDIQLDSIDFQALKLYSSQLRAHGVIHFDFPELNPDYPRGSLTWWQPIINANNHRYYPDSMYVSSRPSADTGQNIVVNLDVFQATVTGKTPFTKIGAIVEDHINRCYAYPHADSGKGMAGVIPHKGPGSPKDTVTIPQDYALSIQGHIIDKPMLHGIFPSLVSFDSIHVDGSLTPRFLTLNVAAPNIVYGPATIENTVAEVRGADSAFTYKITAEQISEGSKLQLWYADIHGDLGQNMINTTISLADAAKKERFALSANILTKGDSQVVQLLPGLKLNYKVWNVAQPNRFVSAPGGFYISNFDIDNAGQFIRANSEQPAGNSPLKVDIGNFRISNITDVISSRDTLLLDGILSGDITLQHMTPNPQLAGNMKIQQLMVLGDTLGDVDAQVSNKDEKSLDTKISLKGQGNDIVLDGAYYPEQNNGNDFDLNLNVNALALHSFESISSNQLRNSSGFIRGQLKLQGTTDAPLVTGELHTDNLVTTVSQLNATFKMPAEKIEFSKNQVLFDNFTVFDSANNKAVVTGTINTEDLADMQMDLKVTAKDWRALHSTVKDNKNFYGNLLLSANLGIKGPLFMSSVDGTVKVLKGTDLVVVNTTSDPQLQSSKGIVVFVNMKDTGRRNVLVVKKKTNVKHKLSPGSEVNVNVSVDKSAQFKMVIDEESGDFITVRGEASLNTAVTPGGEITLSGNYELSEGTYQMSYNFIKRKFQISSGSMIIFAGDPIKGTSLDITAKYGADAPPYDLMEREAQAADLVYYKQKLPFDVTLFMKGNIMQPALTFDVVLPDNKVYPLPPDKIEYIQGKLSQVRSDTTQLNKQVFALLILGRFVSDDPFSSGAGFNASQTAMQSVSSFIGAELNQAAGKLIKGVDFSVDLATTEDYTTGSAQQRTDLNLAASKRLLNDRLKLTVGNDFELEGPQTNNNSQSNLVPSDFAADYLLTADGKYTIRAYRKAYNEGVLEGFITRTGLDFIVNLNFNRFREVWQKKKPANDSLKTKG